MPELSEMVPEANVNDKKKALQEIRFKRHRFNDVLMAYVRAFFREAWCKDNLGETADFRAIWISRISNLEFEKVCLGRYKEIVELILR